MNIEGADHRSGFQQVRDHIIDLGEVLLVIPFGVLLGSPEAESQNPVRLHVRRQDSLVKKSCLLAKDRQNFLVNGICKLMGLSSFGGNFNNSCEHEKFSFRGCRLKGASRSLRAAQYVTLSDQGKRYADSPPSSIAAGRLPK